LNFLRLCGINELRAFGKLLLKVAFRSVILDSIHSVLNFGRSNIKSTGPAQVECRPKIRDASG
jgi:hypothetical protein